MSQTAKKTKTKIGRAMKPPLSNVAAALPIPGALPNSQNLPNLPNSANSSLPAPTIVGAQQTTASFKKDVLDSKQGKSVLPAGYSLSELLQFLKENPSVLEQAKTSSLLPPSDKDDDLPFNTVLATEFARVRSEGSLIYLTQVNDFLAYAIERISLSGQAENSLLLITEPVAEVLARTPSVGELAPPREFFALRTNYVLRGRDAIDTDTAIEMPRPMQPPSDVYEHMSNIAKTVSLRSTKFNMIPEIPKTVVIQNQEVVDYSTVITVKGNIPSSSKILTTNAERDTYINRYQITILDQEHITSNVPTLLTNEEVQEFPTNFAIATDNQLRGYAGRYSAAAVEAMKLGLTFPTYVPGVGKTMIVQADVLPFQESVAGIDISPLVETFISQKGIISFKETISTTSELFSELQITLTKVTADIEPLLKVNAAQARSILESYFELSLAQPNRIVHFEGELTGAIVSNMATVLNMLMLKTMVPGECIPTDQNELCATFLQGVLDARLINWKVNQAQGDASIRYFITNWANGPWEDFSTINGGQSHAISPTGNFYGAFIGPSRPVLYEHTSQRNILPAVSSGHWESLVHLRNYITSAYGTFSPLGTYVENALRRCSYFANTLLTIRMGLDIGMPLFMYQRIRDKTLHPVAGLTSEYPEVPVIEMNLSSAFAFARFGNISHEILRIDVNVEGRTVPTIRSAISVGLDAICVAIGAALELYVGMARRVQTTLPDRRLRSDFPDRLPNGEPIFKLARAFLNEPAEIEYFDLLLKRGMLYNILAARFGFHSEFIAIIPAQLTYVGQSPYVQRILGAMCAQIRKHLHQGFADGLLVFPRPQVSETLSDFTTLTTNRMFSEFLADDVPQLTLTHLLEAQRDQSELPLLSDLEHSNMPYFFGAPILIYPVVGERKHPPYSIYDPPTKLVEVDFEGDATVVYRPFPCYITTDSRKENISLNERFISRRNPDPVRVVVSKRNFPGMIESLKGLLLGPVRQLRSVDSNGLTLVFPQLFLSMSTTDYTAKRYSSPSPPNSGVVAS